LYCVFLLALPGYRRLSSRVTPVVRVYLAHGVYRGLGGIGVIGLSGPITYSKWQNVVQWRRIAIMLYYLATMV
jgi:hypothetical protein